MSRFLSFISFFWLLSSPGLSSPAPDGYFLSCRCGRCGSYDFFRRGDRLSVSYDHCARGGYGSHAVALYEREAGEWVRRKHLSGPAPARLSAGFTCHEYCGGHRCELPSSWRDSLSDPAGRERLFVHVRERCGSVVEDRRGGATETVRFHFVEPARDVPNPAYNRPEGRTHFQCFRFPTEVTCEEHWERR